MRRFLPVLAALALLTVAAPAAEAKTRSCASGDLRYPFEPGGKKTFGVFKLKATGATCLAAHHAAHAWMAEFEASLRGEGPLELPRTAGGFSGRSYSPSRADLPPARYQRLQARHVRLRRAQRLGRSPGADLPEEERRGPCCRSGLLIALALGVIADRAGVSTGVRGRDAT